MKKILLINLCLLLSIISFNNAYSQSINTKIASYLKLISEGRSDEVKNKLTDLTTNYPDEPGVLLLQGALQKNIEKALPIYQRILKKYPNSEWADDAAWRIIQYYSIIGDTAEAAKSLNSFRSKYKNSPFLEPASVAVDMAVSKAVYSITPPKAVAKVLKTQTDDIVSTKQHYGLQVGIYSTLKAAESEKAKYLDLKLRTEIKEKIVNGEKLYAVVIGNYSTEQSALEAKTIVSKQCGCNPIIIKK